MTHPLLDRLAAGPLLADGAMGTVFYASGASLDESIDALNLTRPDCERMLGAPNDRARFLVPRMILLVLQWDSARS
jgi:hypothetical protein